MSPRQGFHYRIYDLNLTSAIPLPELMPANGPPDVHIRLGAVPRSLEQPAIDGLIRQARRDVWLLTAEHITGARFLVRQGREVVVERVGRGRDDVVRAFLLSSCMSALIMQRGLPPLHGNALVGEQGAMLLSGNAGAGKSTLALALHLRGFRSLADDLSAIRMESDGACRVLPGYPSIKVWADACQRLGVNTSELKQIRPELHKYHYPIPPNAFCTRPTRLHAIYFLTAKPIERPKLKPLEGAAKLREIQSHLFKFRFAEAQRVWPWLFGAMIAIASQARVCIIERPKSGCSLDELADLIENDLRQ
ncbi:MAG: hypothetical protein GXP42_00615 [Chloroflexi bacterium]|nr:hypothetical protein [Chloroflexota bacterium]